MNTVQKHFVTFYSPGTFVSETTTSVIKAWDISVAVKMSKKIVERYGATPYGFRFSTRARGPKDLDSKVVKQSCMYYINCRVETYKEIVKRNDPKEEILRNNMRCNKYDEVAVTTKGWKAVYPLEKGDVVL